MGAGSGWLAYLLREKGAHVDAFDAMAGGTFVRVWILIPRNPLSFLHRDILVVFFFSPNL
jgi:hypothetical protein